MKILIAVALLVACANASKLSNVFEKLVPSLTTGHIIKGNDARPHSAPYTVSLSRNGVNHTHMCAGTIINKDWILTAAHCMGNKPVGISVIGGLHKLDHIDNRTQRRVIDFGKVHDSYTGGVGPYDLGLMHVSQSFVINDRVQPAVLPTREEIHEGEIHLYGWGKPKPFNSTAANTLQTVTTQIVPWDECKKMLPENAPLHTSNICSDSLQENISACNGDSGGPLVQEHHKAPAEVIGVVSWGYTPCGEINMPSMYTRVSSYIEWISNVQSAHYTIYKL